MLVELELDDFVDLRFFVGMLPPELMSELRQRKRELVEAVGPDRRYGATGQHEVEAAGSRFLITLRLGKPYTGENGEEVQVVRVLHVIENTASGS